MNSKNTPLILSVVGLTALSLSASAQVTLSGGQLAPSPGGVTYNAYNQTAGGYGGNSASAAYDGGANLSMLNFPGTGGNSYWASVNVPNGYDGVSLGTLDSFMASGSTFDLKSLSGSYPNEVFGSVMISAYWVVTLNVPGGGTVTYSSGADGVLGANTFDQPPYPGWTAATTGASPPVPTPQDYYTGSGPYGSLGANQQLNPNDIATWASLAGTEGTWTVASVGVEIGNWSEVYPTDAEIDSFTLGVPDGGSTLSLLGICFGALAGLRRRLARG
jgi:hypothetical protein